MASSLPSASAPLGSAVTAPSSSSASSAGSTAPRVTSHKLSELVAALDPHERLEPEVEAFLLELADDFVDNLSVYSAAIARQRGAKAIEVKDVAFHLERHWQMRIPGFSAQLPVDSAVSGEEARDLGGGVPAIAALPIVKKPALSDAHKKRLALVAKAKESVVPTPGDGNSERTAAGAGEKERKRKRTE